MSSVVVPPPSSASVVRTGPRLTARARALLTAMNLHFAALASIAVLVLWLLVRVFVVWNGLKANDEAARADQLARLRAAQIAALPVRGLDAKVARSEEEASDFYSERLPYVSSQIYEELGKLSKRTNVHLSRVAYVYPPPQPHSDPAVTEVRIDSSVSGDYRPVIEFINALERDRLFFLVSGLTLSGQTTGQVSLRLRVTTYLREPQGDEIAIAAAAAPAPAPEEGAQP